MDAIYQTILSSLNLRTEDSLEDESDLKLDQVEGLCRIIYLADPLPLPAEGECFLINSFVCKEEDIIFKVSLRQVLTFFDGTKMRSFS